MKEGGGMSASNQALTLFEAGAPVRDVGEMVGMSRTAPTETRIHFAKCPKYSGSTPTADF